MTKVLNFDEKVLNIEDKGPQCSESFLNLQQIVLNFEEIVLEIRQILLSTYCFPRQLSTQLAGPNCRTLTHLREAARSNAGNRALTKPNTRNCCNRITSTCVRCHLFR